MLALAGCAASGARPVESSLPVAASPALASPSVQRSGLLPSGALKRGYYRAGSEGFTNVGLSVGQTAVDFTLQDTAGDWVSLSALLDEKPVIMVLGSFT
jgi:hypothetical protein